MSSGESIDLGDKLGQFTEYWSPKVVGRLNDYEIKVVKLSGEFVWHSHTDTDELFLVVKGELDIQMRDRTVTLGPGQLFVVPRSVEHCPIAHGEVSNDQNLWMSLGGWRRKGRTFPRMI
ncbi:mannose-6-phosphate isomerase [Mycobacteroides abscessus subsp. massiliense]|uniref:cupin domain-containing protein n=1 Tax=Mycobacteroides abscessus TaxID=36809 RepID=UPI0009C7FE5B|nr:cupin domain-containing protein [Mycobacteroides abscessus]SKP42632.1 mannose-6-phosphate isomerase [Mycobacteroides abscessus subsp. massiliense]